MYKWGCSSFHCLVWHGEAEMLNWVGKYFSAHLECEIPWKGPRRAELEKESQKTASRAWFPGLVDPGDQSWAEEPVWSWSSRKSVHGSLCIDLFGSINLRNFSIYTCFHLDACSQGLIFLRSERWIRCFSGCTVSKSAFVRRHQPGFHLIWLRYWDSQAVSRRFVTALFPVALERAESSTICKA